MASKALMSVLISLILTVNGLDSYNRDPLVRDGNREADLDRILDYAVPDYKKKMEYISSNPDEIKLCGQNLGDAIYIICTSNRLLGNMKMKPKRNLKLLAPLLLNKMVSEHERESNNVDDGYRYKWPWSMLERRRTDYESRLKRVYNNDDDDGVASLCCNQPCSYKFLLSYCKTDDDENEIPSYKSKI